MSRKLPAKSGERFEKHRQDSIIKVRNGKIPRQPFMSTQEQPAQSEWHITKASTGSRRHIFLISTQRLARKAWLYSCNLQSIVQVDHWNCQLTCQDVC